MTRNMARDVREGAMRSGESKEIWGSQGAAADLNTQLFWKGS